MLADIKDFSKEAFKGSLDIKKFKKLIKTADYEGFSLEYLATKMGYDFKSEEAIFAFLNEFKSVYEMGAKQAGLSFFIWTSNIESFYNYHKKALFEFAKNEAVSFGGNATLSSFCELCLGGKKDYLGDLVMGDGYEFKEALVFGILNFLAYSVFEGISKSDFLECFSN